MFTNVLCDLPIIDIDEDERDSTERGKAYLDSLIREIRQENSGSTLVWQFSFDMVRSQHAHGPMFVADCDIGSTRLWLLSYDPSSRFRKGSSFREAIPRPEANQYVAHISVGYAELAGSDLMRALAMVMAEKIMSA